MVKRSRLPKKVKKNQKARLKKDVVKLMDVLKEGEKELEHGVGELAKGGGAFLHELMYLETPEEARAKKLVAQANKLMAMHPKEAVWLKVMLREEPDVGAGLDMVVRAEDLAHFNELEAEDLDTGNIYTVRRNNILKIIGIAREPHASTPAFPESPIQMSDSQ
jgi:hypothetical protein